MIDKTDEASSRILYSLKYTFMKLFDVLNVCSPDKDLTKTIIFSDEWIFFLDNSYRLNPRKVFVYWKICDGGGGVPQPKEWLITPLYIWIVAHT